MTFNTSMHRMRSLCLTISTVVSLALGLCSCARVTAPSIPTNPPVAIQEKVDSPAPSSDIPTPTPLSSGNSSSPGAEVMGPTSDSSTDAQKGSCGHWENLKEEYRGTSLRIPECMVASVGWQPANSQNPVSEPNPTPQWIDNKWQYSLTLTIQALYSRAGHWDEHQDFLRGPVVRLFFSDHQANATTAVQGWSEAAYCDVPLYQWTRREPDLVSNFSLKDHFKKDTDLDIYVYYRPPPTATSALDYDPVIIPGEFAVATLPPAENLCDYKILISHEDFAQFDSDIHALKLGHYLIDIDETVPQPAVQVHPLPSSTTPQSSGVIILKDPQDDPAATKAAHFKKKGPPKKIK